MKKFSFLDAVETMIDEINVAKHKANKIHKSGDIRGSGDEVENMIREIISLFLPEKYLVREGHIIDEQGNVSNQFDIIIFDRLNTPKFFETDMKSVYYPIESVLAVGEIKKTLQPDHSVEFASKLLHLKTVMKRKLIENTVFGGVRHDSQMTDALNIAVDQKYKNPLYSFIFAIDGDIDKVNIGDAKEIFANDIVVLNHGYMYPANRNKGFINQLTHDDAQNIDELHTIYLNSSDVLARFLDRLIKHLNKCVIDPISITNYITRGEILSVHTEKITIRKW